MLPHESEVWQCAFSPDGRLLFSVSKQGALRLWSVPAGKLLAQPVAPFAESLPNDPCFAFSHDGRRALICLPARHGRYLWDLRAVHYRAVPLAYDNTYERASFSADDRTITVSGNHRAFILDAVTGQLRHEPIVINPVEFQISHNGRLIVNYGDNALVNVWDMHTAQHVALLRHPHKVDFAAFSPDDRLLATVGGDGILRVWEIATGRLVIAPRFLSAERVNRRISPIKFLPDGRSLIVCRQHETRILRLKPSERSIPELRQLAILLSGQHFETMQRTGMADAATLVHAWRSLYRRQPVSQALSRKEETQWRIMAQAALLRQEDMAIEDTRQARIQSRDETNLMVDFPTGEQTDWSGLARACAGARQWEWAETAATRALMRIGQDWQSSYLRAVASEHLGRYQDAVSDLDNALKPGNEPLPDWMQGQLFIRRENLNVILGRREQVAADCRRIILAAQPEYLPHYAPLYYRQALMLLETGKVKEYRTLCEEMWRKCRDIDDIVFSRYTVYVCSLAPGALNDSAAVVALARSVVAASGSNAQSILALALVRAGKTDEALRLLDTAPDSQNDGPDRDLVRALAYRYAGNRSAASLYLSRAFQRLQAAGNGLAPSANQVVWPRQEAELWRGEILQAGQ